MNRAKWITLGSLPSMMPANYDILNGSIYFRKQFSLKNDIKSVKLSICALGQGEYFVNGKPVADEVLPTPFTRFDARVIYNVYDITHLVNIGENAIGVHVGNGFYNDNMSVWNDIMTDWKDNPKLAAAIEISYQSGKTEVIRTDKTWRCTEGCAIYNHVKQGEICDARLRQNGYDTVDFDDSEWENAALTNEPGGILEIADVPPVRVIRTLKPVRFENDIYDFGENISGWVKIKVHGKAGQEIRILYDESFEQFRQMRGADTCFAFAQRENKPVANEDIFICSGIEEEFRPSFCYHGFQYAKLENAPDNVEIVAEVVHTDLETIGTFECSDDMINKIHLASVRATLANFVGMPTDCPHREQFGWTNDAQTSTEQVLMNFDAKRSYAKWLRDFKDAQRPSGQLPGIIPCTGWGYNWGQGPGFGCAIIIIPYNIYINTGDTKILADMWENMVKYLGCLERMSDNYIVDYGLGDWVPVHQPACPRAIIDTAYFYNDCVKMAEIAKLIGKDSTEWSEKAAKIKSAFRKEFIGKPELETYQTYFACMIFQGLLEENEIPEYAAKLNQLVIDADYHIDCGMFGTKYIFSALSENGYTDTIYKMVTNPTFPSYAYWILNGRTTLCETWDMQQSLNHHLYSEVDNWIYRYLGGFRYYKDGLVINPVYMDNIDFVKAQHKGISVVRNGKNVTVSTPIEVHVVIGKHDAVVQPGKHEFCM